MALTDHSWGLPIATFAALLFMWFIFADAWTSAFDSLTTTLLVLIIKCCHFILDNLVLICISPDHHIGLLGLSIVHNDIVIVFLNDCNWSIFISYMIHFISFWNLGLVVLLGWNHSTSEDLRVFNLNLRIVKYIVIIIDILYYFYWLLLLSLFLWLWRTVSLWVNISWTVLIHLLRTLLLLLILLIISRPFVNLNSAFICFVWILSRSSLWNTILMRLFRLIDDIVFWFIWLNCFLLLIEV